MQTIKIVAYRLGENILLKQFREAHEEPVYSFSPTEVFIKKGESSYIYIQNYGEVAFANCTAGVISEFIALIKPFVDSPVSADKEYKEEFALEVKPDQPLLFNFNSLHVPRVNEDVIKIVLLNVNQSVVLDYFTELAQTLLFETNKYTMELEQRGKISVSKNSMMKLIGKTLNIQNRITDNLYFLDAPDTVWEDEYLAHINAGLSNTFHLKTRFREVEYTLKIIDNNQNIFVQLVQHRDANKLEWVIILLIFLEVVNTLFGRFIFK